MDGTPVLDFHVVHNRLHILDSALKRASSDQYFMARREELGGRVAFIDLAGQNLFEIGLDQIYASLGTDNPNTMDRLATASHGKLLKFMTRVRDTFIKVLPVLDQILPVGDEAVACAS